MIELKELTIHVKDFMADAISLTVRPGEIHALIGPSGAGKTLILETIAGLYNPHSGNILIDKQDITEYPPEKRAFAYVPQDTSLFPHLSVEENILYGLKVVNKYITSELRNYIDRIIERLNIKHLTGRFPSRLSGGERQRVALARALAIQPKLILLDEPTSALDPSIREETCYLFKELHREFQFTALLVTHNFEEAFFLSDVFSILIDGRIKQTGKRKEVLYHPRDVSVARFLGVSNLFRGRIVEVKEDRVVIYWIDEKQTIIARRTFRDTWVKEGVDIFWGIRPEDVHIIKGEKKAKGQNLFHASLLAVYSGKNMHNLVTTLNIPSPLRGEGQGGGELRRYSDENAGSEVKISLRDTVLQRLQISSVDAIQICLIPEHIILLPYIST
ncbi:MAG: ABC transporter ATP-binding protein [Nitrospirae bacterium]|nr:ABC transporter ATP-binding protein [Nitrospirota bacterium]